jgi:cation:H+ antiporter
VFAWRQQAPLLLANLTGALRLLTGLGWPVIYFTAAIFHRRRSRTPLRSIKLDEHHSVEVMGLLVPLIYIAVICAKATLTIFDAAVLIAIYAAYLAILSRLPPEALESIEELELIPRTIVTSRRAIRVTVITALFLGGALLIRYTAEPFVGSLLAIAGVLGVSSFLAVQWLAPIISEFPEMASTVYFARTVDRAPMALMNMVSSNINQWTLLIAMLPIVYSASAGRVSIIVFDTGQQVQLLMTLGQALVGMMFLINMELAWWEAVALLALFAAAFVSPVMAKPVTAVYFLWAGYEMWRLAAGQREPVALLQFVEIWKKHVSR